MHPRHTLVLGVVGIVLALVVPDPAPAAQVCGCKRTTNGRVRRITAGNPLVCPTSQVLVCWNEDPPPGDISARVFNSANLSLSHNTTTALPFDSERWDTDDMHDTVTNSSRLTAQESGKYLIFANVKFGENASGTREVLLRLNGTTVIAEERASANVVETGIAGNVMSLTTHYSLAAGDYVEFVVTQTSGSTINVLSDPQASPEFGMVKLP